jgi:homocysteine S-methyltransferase
MAMGGYADLERRIEGREIILLDGAIGTQLQSMGVPMGDFAWAAVALESHPFTVRRLHENYIAAGVDIITVNSYASARHNLEPIGLGDKTTELNLRAVMLAQDARDRAARERPVLIAGSVSNYGIKVACEPGWTKWTLARRRSETSEAQARQNLREQAELLAEAGVDFLLAESTGGNTHRKWVVEACASTGLPVWAGFKCRLHEDEVRLGYTSELSVADGFDEVIGLGGSVVTIFHSPIAATNAALPVIRNKWSGPICVYPEAEREDYVATYRNDIVPTPVTPDEYVAWAKGCVEQGVQIVGGCCGIEIEHIRPLRDALPTHLPKAT